jgi:flagellar biosynthesis GTPase FlhF
VTDNYNILIGKLDEFIRKYYKNQLIRGGIYSVSALLLFFITVALLEYVGHFGISARSIMFYSYLLVNLVIIVYYFVIPLLKLNKIGKIISHEQAADIIGRHFSDVKDKLINTLQLKKLEDDNTSNTALIRASIDQKIFQLKPVPFSVAIDLKQNRKYIKYAAIPLLFIVFVLFAAPSIITDSTKRLIHHGTFYEKEAPFQFQLLNNKMEAVQQEDFLLKVKLTGNEIPDNVFVDVDGNQYQLLKDNTVNFHYNFKNLQKDVKFQLTADGFSSKEYEINVLPKPIILNFDVDLSYPAYINKKDESLQNTGDLVVPEGTIIKWHFLTRDVRNIGLRFKDKSVKSENKNENSFSYASMFKNSQNYTIVPSNEHLVNKDSLTYTISVIPDAYPTIKVVEFKDSVFENHRYFKGMIKDDYGFTALTFNYRKLNGADSLLAKKPEIKTVTINKNTTQQEFYYYFDFSAIAKNPGDEYEYYFEVWDNDGVNGSKATRSQKVVYKLPTQEELDKKTDKSNDQIKNDLNQSIIEAKQLQKQIEDFNKKLIDKNTLTWQDKKDLQDMLDKQLKLQDKIDQVQKENSEKTQRENQFNKPDEELLKKQEELNKLFNDLMTDEMKEMFKKLQDMLDKVDKNKVADMLDKMKLSNKDLEKQLDRNLELFKQLEFEKKLTESINKLDTLAKKQDALSKETEKKDAKNNNEDLKNKQQELNKDFENFQKDLKDAEKKNQELQEPNKFDSTSKEQNNIKQDMKNSQENLNNKKNGRASQSQQKAAQDMQELEKKLSDMQQEENQESQSEDINSLRQILENLIKASFDQENLMDELADTKTTDPKYINVMQDQKNLQKDLQMIEDSLFALSKRQMQIESFVNKEISSINNDVDKALEALSARNISAGKSKQQSAMTSINNLALMLSETLNAMKEQQQQGKPGAGKCSKPEGKCSKPGSGKPSFKSMQQMQEQLNKDMESLKNGKNPNGKEGQAAMSEELAKLAAEQAAIRKQLQELEEELKKEGQTNTGGLNGIQNKMEQTETDLVNKIINNETIKRQKEILTRLLESEKAQKERELDEKRESHEAKNENISNPSKILEYNSIKLKEVELLKTVPPSLKSFYKSKVNEYFYNFED